MFNSSPLTKVTCLLILSMAVYSIFTDKNWENEERIIQSDVRGYYAYLPAAFINNDLKFERLQDFKGEVWTTEDEEGRRFIKYTCGMSIMYSPFFFAAHQYTKFTNYESNGYSLPYRFSLAMASIFYLMISLIFLSKFLLKYFEDSVVYLVLIILFLGTNIWHYFVYDLALSHTYSFALISIFLFALSKWLETPKYVWALLMGFTAGMFVLIRPIDIVFLFAIVLLGVNSKTEFLNRLKLLWNNKFHLLTFLCFFLLPIFTQLLYYNYIFGSFVYYSYTKETFFFGNPQLFNSIFSYRNGWLVYSPIMMFSIVGLFFMKSRPGKLKKFVLLAAALYIYVISSWWCWWYGGYGNRAFINLYPLLAIPLASFIHFVLNRSIFYRIVFKMILVAFILLNFFQTFQFQNHMIHWGSMSKEAYWDSFGRTEQSQLYKDKLRYPDLHKAVLGIDAVYTPIIDTISEYNKSFENSFDAPIYNSFIQKEVTRSGLNALHYPEGHEYLCTEKIPIKGLTHVYFSVWVKNSDSLSLVLAGDELYFGVQEIAASEGEWNKLHLNAFFPNNTEDSAKVYIWNPSLHELWIDDYYIMGSHVKFESVNR